MIKGVIFDRDGTLIEHVPYLHKLVDVNVIQGVFNAAQQLHHLGIKVLLLPISPGLAVVIFRKTITEWLSIILSGFLKRMVVQLPKHIIARVILSMGLVSIK